MTLTSINRFASRPVLGLGLSPGTADELARRFRLVRLPDAVEPNAEVLVAQKGAVDAPLLDRLPALRLVATSAAGFDNVDIARLRARGIMLSNRQNAPDHCVADLAIGLLIAAVRRIAASDRLIREGRWADARFQHPQRVSGGRLGVLGLGRIGEDICRRAAGFDMEIGYHNRQPRPELPYRHFPELLQLAEWCDFLVVAVPLTAATRRQVTREVLTAVGPLGAVVNIARGAVIDEEALIAALETGALGSAGLDVFMNEPNVSPRLLALDNVVMTPHIGGFTAATQADALRALIANVESYFDTGRPIAQIDLDRA
jgi:lactate dehydrogenase-like 2-hydroxyacid dehydrogenase